LSLADTFNSAFPVDEDIVKTYGAIIDGLNIKQRRDKLESEIKDKDGTLIKKLSDLDNERDEKKQKADKININNRNAPNWDSDSREKSKLNSQIERIEEEIRKVKDDIKEKKKEYDALAIFVDDGRDS